MGMTRDGRASLSLSKKQLDARGAPREEAEIGASLDIRCTQGRAQTDSCYRVHGFAFLSSSLRPFRRLLLCAKTSLLHFGLSENLSVGGLISKKLLLDLFGGPSRERCWLTTYRGAETSSIPCLEILGCLFVTEPLLSMCSLRILTTSAIPSGF